MNVVKVDTLLMKVIELVNFTNETDVLLNFSNKSRHFTNETDSIT